MSDIPLIPSFERLVVKRDDPETVTASGVVLPDDARELPNTGIVLAKGDSPADWPGLMDKFQVGQRVLFSKYGADEVKVDGVAYLLVSARDVKAVLTTKGVVSE